MSDIKHSHQTGKLSHLEMVIMLTQAIEELGITSFNELQGDMHDAFCHAMQQAFEHGMNSPFGRERLNRYIQYRTHVGAGDFTRLETGCGWIDSIRGNLIQIQCDDGYKGARGLMIREDEIQRYLADKPRPGEE